tara:strand:+ start:1561 stop:1737 length:177 start_codon:yes stop_codon:yes gene_type:complete
MEVGDTDYVEGSIEIHRGLDEMEGGQRFQWYTVSGLGFYGTKGFRTYQEALEFAEATR